MEEQIDDTDHEESLREMEEENKKKTKKSTQETPSDAKNLDTEDRERILLAQMLNNDDLFIKGIAFLEKDFFESKINKLIVDFIKDYYDNYKSVPPEDAVLVNLGLDDTRSDWLDVKKPWPSKFLEDYLNAFVKNMSMKSAIEDSIELLADEDYGLIEKKIKEAVNVDIDTKIGMTIDTDKDNFRSLFKLITSEEMTIPTGWENLDAKLDGGVNVPSLNYILAKSGGGKSVGLVNLSWNYVQQGKDVVYISLELNEAKVMKRYITHSAKVPTYMIPSKEMEIYNHLKTCDKKGFGRFTVHFYQPNTLTSMKLELFLRNYVQRYGTVPVIILDYAGLMIPNGKGWQGMFERDKYVSEELRGVATMFDTVCWTADQYNRCLEINELVQTKESYKPIGELRIGEKIKGTNDEWRTIIDKTPVEEQDVYEITTKTGKKIKVSGRHIIPKQYDGKIIDDNIFSSLKVGDKIFIDPNF